MLSRSSPTTTLTTSADRDRSDGCRRVDHPPALDELHLARGYEPSGGPAYRLEVARQAEGR